MCLLFKYQLLVCPNYGKIRLPSEVLPGDYGWNTGVAAKNTGGLATLTVGDIWKKVNLNSTAAVCCIHCMSVCTYRLCFVLLSFLCPRLQSYGPLKTLFSTCPFVCACVDACLRVWSETFCACRPLLGIIFYLKILLYIYWHSNVTLCNFLII